ncbi:DUF1616 domain-containing protein [Halorubrum sp. AS12]|uniref:DUF1616 domain-containing protein n=1 Tax=Halorubrum sp. AS12 TaxID=3409687 RepID=UPI003DA6F257
MFRYRMDTKKTVVTWILVVALLISILGIGYISTYPPSAADPYSEFYVLSTEGDADNYPRNLSVNTTGTVIVGVTNHEQQDMTYTVVTELDNNTIDQQQVRINNGETWEENVSFTTRESGRQKLRLLLYKGGSISGKPYRSLRLWLNVSTG